jgi:IS5 family transposase
MYSTDLEKTQWQIIKKILNLQERKRKYALHGIWNAIFYLVKTGCQWSMLPCNFASYELVYYYYRKWSSLGGFDLLLNNLRKNVHKRTGQNAERNLGIMQSAFSLKWLLMVIR